MLELLTRKDDPRAQALREHFVFKIVPMLNPDGVANGHFRADTRGLNLNRFYDDPDPDMHPSVWALRRLVEHHARADELFLYLDLHAHVSKRGCFFYGNHLPALADQVENELFVTLASLHSEHIDVPASCFSEKNMHTKDKREPSASKDGSSRVAFFTALGITRCYTLECNYNTGRTVNKLPPARQLPGGAGASRCATPRGRMDAPPRYSPPLFAGVGRACLYAMLELRGLHPASRVPGSEFRTLVGARRCLSRRLALQSDYRVQALQEKADKAAAGAGRQRPRRTVRPRAAAAPSTGRGRPEEKKEGEEKKSPTVSRASSRATSRSGGASTVSRQASSRVRGGRGAREEDRGTKGPSRVPVLPRLVGVTPSPTPPASNAPSARAVSGARFTVSRGRRGWTARPRAAAAVERAGRSVVEATDKRLWRLASKKDMNGQEGRKAEEEAAGPPRTAGDAGE